MSLLRTLLTLCLLASAALAAPTVSVTSPTPGNTVSSFSSVSITFSEAVTGVEARSLLINNESAATVTGSGSGPYVFTFTQPAPGLVSLSWDFDQQIAGLGTGAFAPTTGWTYTLTDTIAPTLAVVTPADGSTLATLTQAQVTFSESVTGVDAADLLVNGVAATGVTGTGAGPYVFTFAAPAVGPVSFTWAAGHGITDSAPTPNAFAGAGWNVTKVSGSAGTLIINEFLAANGTGLADENGDNSGWIEIYNPGTTSVNLAGWSLTDDVLVPGMWVFPSRTLAANSYLVVFASAKDRRPASGNLHTNFKLNPTGGYLALFTPDSPRVATTAFNPYPAQRYDFSFGQQTGGALRYFSPPKPNAANGTSSFISLTPNPNVSVNRGLFKDPFQVVVSCPDASATIRYTLDGTLPTTASPVYTVPLNISATTLLRLTATGATSVVSEIVTHSYIYLDGVFSQASPPYGAGAPLPTVGGTTLPVNWGTYSGSGNANSVSLANTLIPADYGMDPEIYNDGSKYDDTGAVSAAGKTNLDRIKQGLRDLPTLSVVIKPDDMFGTDGIYSKSLIRASSNPSYTRACSMELLLQDGTTGFATTSGIQIHGNSSRDPYNNPKHGFTVKFKGDFGASKLDYKLFPDSPAAKQDNLVLRADYNTSWTHWDPTQRIRGNRLRDAFSKDLFRGMGAAAGHALYVNFFIDGIFWGVYDIAESEDDGFASNYFGGDSEDYDVMEQGVLKSGTATAYNAMTAIASPIDNTKYEQMKTYLDVPWFVDYMLLHFYLGHEDWGADINKNWFAVRNSKKNGTFKFLPWDMENLMYDPNVDRTTVTAPAAGLHPKLVTNTQYQLDFADRVYRHMVSPDGALLSAAVAARFTKWQNILTNAIAGESARWGDYRRDVQQRNAPNLLYTWNGLVSGAANTSAYGSWVTENNTRLKGTYFPNRTATVLAQLRARSLYPALNAPDMKDNASNLTLASQSVNAGFQVKLVLSTMTGTNAGTIYYTTDGTDPRVYYSGTVGATATSFSAATPITINATTTVKARCLNGATWSALNQQTFTVAAPGSPIRITEIMYNPPNNYGGTAAEFIELQNTGTSSVDLTGFHFDGIDYIFPFGSKLGAGDRLVLASNNTPTTFASTYPGVVVAGYYSGTLDNGGERITLYDGSDRLVCSVNYDDENGWPTSPDGSGYSLEIIDPAGNPDSYLNWKASNAVKGTPGQANSVAAASSVIINEVVAENLSGPVVANGQAYDYIELKNTGASAVSVAGWTVTVRNTAKAVPATLTLPAGTQLLAGGFLVIPCSPSAPGTHLAAELSLSGGSLQLSNATSAVADSIEWGAQIVNLGIGRVSGAWTLTTPTVGADNTAAPQAPVAGNLVLNEWLADTNPGLPDWIELYNKNATLPVALQGLYFQTDTDLFRFPLLAFVAPQGFLQLFADEKSGANQLFLKLPAVGTALSILNANGVAVDALTKAQFGVAGPGITRGRSPDGGGTIVTFNGSVSPGIANFVNNWTGPVLNEVVARSSTTDWVELYNGGASPFDLSGLKLGVTSDPSLGTWTFPAGTVLASGGYLTLRCTTAQPASTTTGPDLNTALALGDSSGGLYLFNQANQNVNLVEWGPQIVDVSIGLDAGTWKLLALPTPGAANAAAAALGLATALKINEWVAAPVTGGVDFLELYNTSATPVALAGLYLTDDPSEVGRLKFKIAPLSFIAANGWAKFDADGTPANGRDHVNFGLSNDADYLRLSNSDASATVIDAVGFGTQLNGVAQGRITDGQTLQNLLAPTPGAANLVLTAPSVTSQPQSVIVAQGASAPFAGTFTSGSPISYQWKFNSSNLASATATAYTVTNAAAANEGSYTLTATNAAGSTVSSAATLTIGLTFAQWATSKGITGALGADDADGDGISNMQEFLHNLDPLHTPSTADTLALPRVGLEPATGTPQYLTVTYRRNGHAAVSSIAHELSLDLNAWSQTAPAITESLGNDPVTGDPWVRVKFNLQPGMNRDFLRLKVTP